MLAASLLLAACRTTPAPRECKLDSSVAAIAFLDADTVGCGLRDGSVQRWSLTTGAVSPLLTTGSASVTAMASSGDGVFAVGFADGRVQLWDGSAQPSTVTPFDRSIRDLAFSVRNLAILGDGGAVAQWARSGLREIAVVAQGRAADPRTALTFQSERLVAGHASGRMQFDATQASSPMVMVALAAAWGVTELIALPGRVVVGGGFAPVVLYGDLRQPPVAGEQPQHWILCMAASSDGSLLVTGHAHGEVWLWRTLPGRELSGRKLAQVDGAVRAIALRPETDGVAFASGATLRWLVLPLD